MWISINLRKKEFSLKLCLEVNGFGFGNFMGKGKMIEFDAQ